MKDVNVRTTWTFHVGEHCIALKYQLIQIRTAGEDAFFENGESQTE